MMIMSDLRNDTGGNAFEDREPREAIDRMLRTGGTSGRTAIFDMLDPEGIDELVSEGVCAPGEVPLMASSLEEGAFLVTTERILLDGSRGPARVDWTEIDDVVPMAHYGLDAMLDDSDEPWYIGIITRRGECHLLPAEQGLPFHGIHNMLVWMLACRRSMSGAE